MILIYHHAIVALLLRFARNLSIARLFRDAYRSIKIVRHKFFLFFATVFVKMTENVRQRKRVDEPNVQSSRDGVDQNVIIDQDDRRPRNQSVLSLS